MIFDFDAKIAEKMVQWYDSLLTTHNFLVLGSIFYTFNKF